MRLPSEGRTRVVIEDVTPEVDGGRFPVKCTVGELIGVEAAIFADGHDLVSCVVLHKFADEAEWHSLPMKPVGNDTWRADFKVSRLGRHSYTIEGWVDHFKTWQADLKKRIAAAQDLSVDLIIGSQFIAKASSRASGDDVKRLQTLAAAVAAGDTETAQSEELLAMMQAWPDPSLAIRYERELTLWVEPTKARFSAWYEFFPRSTSRDPPRAGTFKDCVAWLSYIAEMGFDVVYLPPIHPIGKRFRKGKNNAPTVQPDDPGSPWAIGDKTGGHTALHPELGTVDDFQLLLAEGQRLGLDIALDIAFQCSPDHPWVREHPEWFRKRPDGSIQYAENPPKKYQDIYPLDFETEQWPELWIALKGVIEFWVAQGIRFFRVDNPHTKAFPFWEWAIGSIKENHPEVIFLAEAFTRPHLVQRLAKLGFTQSYTYFTWRNTKKELTDYFKALSQRPLRNYFRGNLWPNTPDILPETLQAGGRAAFMVRLMLAATLGANYGIYGPAFELVENVPREPGSEEYLNSEKYEVKHRELTAQSSLKDFIARVNRIRRENIALQNDHSLAFHETDNQNLICYSKFAEDPPNMVIVVVNLDWAHTQGGWITLDLEALGLERSQSFEVHDLLSGSRFLWQGPRDYVELTPVTLPGHILLVRRRVRTERDFDYYL